MKITIYFSDIQKKHKQTIWIIHSNLRTFFYQSFFLSFFLILANLIIVHNYMHDFTPTHAAFNTQFRKHLRLLHILNWIQLITYKILFFLSYFTTTVKYFIKLFFFRGHDLTILLLLYDELSIFCFFILEVWGFFLYCDIFTKYHFSY
jgi:hypothetical protein